MDKTKHFPNTNLDLELTNNLEFWMTKLPKKLRSTPIIDLAIPGSHDSATYCINRNSQIAPDAECVIVILRFLGPIIKTIVSRWSKTQNDNITNQLNSGIRYFDLRIATKKDDNRFYIVHGLYAIDVSDVAKQIKTFLGTHPKEIVILDCQHFYAMEESDHERLINFLTSTFASKLLPYEPEMDNISLNSMTDVTKYQIIIIYRNDAALEEFSLWPSVSFPTSWADTNSISKLLKFLSEKLENRDNDYALISQCILTPRATTVLAHLFSSLRRSCVLPLEKKKYPWLREQKPGRVGGVNIVISDFVEMDAAKFSREVISLNRKLLDNVD